MRRHLPTVLLSLALCIGSIHLAAQAPSFTSPAVDEASTACNTAWDLSIAVRDRISSNRDTVYIAQSTSATDGIDAGCNEAEVPPVPPSPTFGVNFQLPDGATYSKRDYRGTGDQATWTLTFSGKPPFRFSWDPTNLPAGVFRITDTVDGGIVNEDMASRSVLVVRDRSVTSLTLSRYPAANCIDLDVTKGWNLVSIPVDAPDKRARSLFRSRRIKAYGYASGYQRNTQLTPGKGYWIKFPRTKTYSICGQPAGGSASLVEGWNLVATHNADVAAADASTAPSGIITSSFFGYGPTYTEADTLKTGKAYWVEANGAGTLTVADAGKRHTLPLPAPAEEREGAEEIDPSWAVLNVQSAAGITQELYLSPDPLSTADWTDFEMPPRAPGRVFDARFMTNLQAASVQRGPATLKFEGHTTPLTMAVTNLPYGSLLVESLDARKPLRLQVAEGRPAVVPAGYGVFSIRHSSSPVSVEASPNQAETLEVVAPFPNPFSAETTIQLHVRRARHVRISVFNLLGQEVQRLWDETMAPGIHRVPFDGRSLPAGLYLYRVDSENFASTHPLSLVR